MKKKYIKNLILLFTLFTICSTYAQDINFTFANAQNTNDGVDDFYEVDVLIQTINGSGTFKLGSGQLYFVYNTDAFGENVQANSNIEITQPNADAYICGQYVDAAAADIYGVFTINDNTTSRVSWAFSQVFSASTFANDNITETPQKLIHLKLKYEDVSQSPMLTFEDGDVYDDQFYTACGPTGGPFEAANCGDSPGIQIVNDYYNSTDATLSTNPNLNKENSISIYPNPTSDVINISTLNTIKNIQLFDFLGKRILESSQSQIDLSSFNSGLYILKIQTDQGEITKKVIKN
ncbi:T9SS type A sorting domain-containing protein [Oceanihabitans sp. 2_MG-2023]|uniref:T9SS type A sorting domain-containing protein n=1 Tax=Oceanihabitans sp. 2_MG-2023 TaxID=3062661 RepID=UPI0026E176C1|nr:T9SS type A sorting domain-containing protein [Oceanihabitans sp. 2_MG-2023]MDO6596399.1 T9SS type A sorting domain-containing protein [Oceanihabitans sp. 2_MG-2023]